jgi:DNA-binding transcriptional MerR regulator
MEKYRNWRGNLDELGATATNILAETTGAPLAQLSTRLLRDYISRGLLGDPDRKGRELLFTYDNLLRLVMTRILLADGWMLGKIQEHFALSSTVEIEDLFPAQRSDALATLSRLKKQVPSTHSTEPDRRDMVDKRWAADARVSLSNKIAQNSSIQVEMREALLKLGISGDGPAIEDIKLFAIAPWFQALVQADRLRTLTRKEAEEIGAGVTAALTALILKRGTRHD